VALRGGSGGLPSLSTSRDTLRQEGGAVE
jgi:hypothetical protein